MQHRSLGVALLSFVLSTLLLCSCSHVSTVRLQPNAIEVGPNLRPIAGIQADAISLYILFVAIPGVDLNKVVNQMLVVAAKTIGADKIANLEFEIDPDGGIWALRKLLFYRSARASGIAVQVMAPAEDPSADEGPEENVSPVPTDVAPVGAPGMVGDR